MRLMLFLGENPNTGTKGENASISFGTIVPDHVGDNYAFISSCRIVGGNLVIEFDAKPLNIDITTVSIGCVDTAMVWDDATKTLTGPASAQLTAMFGHTGSNTDNLCSAVAAVHSGPKRTIVNNSVPLVNTGVPVIN